MRLINLMKTLHITCSYQTLRFYNDVNVPRALRSLKPKSSRDTVQYYVDSLQVRAIAGSGGDGCVSFLSAWCKENAGPDGGDGGHGGHVIFQATHSVKSLNHFRRVIRALPGEKGYNKGCNGKNASHVVIPVPLGTIIKNAQGTVVCEMGAEGCMFVAARGGAGGRGNTHFLTATEQAPEIAQRGAIGETLTYHISLRAKALCALLGAPSAGKSSLLRAVTRARPKTHASYFTTRQPHIGVIHYEDHEQVPLADLPGLIEGSHQNRGLGIKFLQHVERCHGLIYLLDGAADPLAQLEMLIDELTNYSKVLLDRPYCLLVNKMDLDEVGAQFEEIKTELQKMAEEKLSHPNEFGVIGISALSGLNLGRFLKIVRIMYDRSNE